MATAELPADPGDQNAPAVSGSCLVSSILPLTYPLFLIIGENHGSIMLDFAGICLP